MMLLQLKGRLGNQMFQYAAVRTLAEKRGEKFYFTGKGTSLHRYFKLGGAPRLEWFRGKWIDWLGRKPALSYSPSYRDYAPGCNKECFDPDFFKIPAPCSISGWLQSHHYFEENRARVLDWFTPQDCYLQQLDAWEKKLGSNPEERCCIHIRLTDYMKIDDGLGRGETGWALPASYYQKALQQLPSGLQYILISDDPEKAKALLDGQPGLRVLHGKSPVVDMFAMTRCRYNVIANSSFSWWGAWCNSRPDRVIAAPLYHTGWAIQQWCPDHLEVPNWIYINPLERNS